MVLSGRRKRAMFIILKFETKFFLCYKFLNWEFEGDERIWGELQINKRANHYPLYQL